VSVYGKGSVWVCGERECGQVCMEGMRVCAGVYGGEMGVCTQRVCVHSREMGGVCGENVCV